MTEESTPFVDCPVCKRMKMPKGNKFCSIDCYNLNNGLKNIIIEND